MNIKVLGYYGRRNAGDNSYLLAFPILFPTHNFDFISSAKGVDFSSTDLIILGGGDVVYTSYTSPLYNLDIPKMAMSTTITSGSDLAHLGMFEKVIVRDEMSLAIASQHNNNVSYLPDFSFALTPNRERGRSLLSQRAEEVGVRLTNKLMTFVINSYIAYNDPNSLDRDVNAFQTLIHCLAGYIDRSPHSAIFLPFSTKLPHDDIISCGWLAGRCKKNPEKNLLIRNPVITAQDTLDMIAASDVVLSTRLHSSIFSTLSKIPFVDLTHHDKNLGYLRSIGREEWSTWIWAEDFNFRKVEKLMNDFLLVGGGGSDLDVIVRKLKEQLSIGSKNLLR